MKDELIRKGLFLFEAQKYKRTSMMDESFTESDSTLAILGSITSNINERIKDLLGRIDRPPGQMQGWRILLRSEMATNRSQRIDKSRFSFGIPGRLSGWQVSWVESMRHEGDQAEQSQQARSSPSDGRGTPLPLGFQTEMSPGFFKSDLDVPPGHVPANDLKHSNGGIGAKEGKRRALAAWIAQKDPTHGQWGFPIAMP